MSAAPQLSPGAPPALGLIEDFKLDRGAQFRVEMDGEWGTVTGGGRLGGYLSYYRVAFDSGAAHRVAPAYLRITPRPVITEGARPALRCLDGGRA